VDDGRCGGGRKAYPGASHAYLGFPEAAYPATREVFADIKAFVDGKLA